MRTTIRWTVLGTSVAFLLACGGLPIPSIDGAEPAVEGVETVEAEQPAAPPPSPESLFADLDAAEAPPARAPSCPSGHVQVRYPRGNALEVYCADGAGTKSGPWTRWVGSRLTESREYAGGQLDGRLIRWSDGRKQSEQHQLAGQAHGSEAAWDADGRLVLRGENKSGARDGRWIVTTPGDDGPIFGGACYQDGAEAWTTADPVELVTRTCGTDELAQNG